MPPNGINIEGFVFVCFWFRYYDRHETPGLRGGQSEQLYSSAVVGPHVLDTAHQPVPFTFEKQTIFSQVCLTLAKLFSPHLGKLSSTLTFLFKHPFVRAQVVPSSLPKVTPAEKKKINRQCSPSSANRSVNGIWKSSLPCFQSACVFTLCGPWRWPQLWQQGQGHGW